MGVIFFLKRIIETVFFVEIGKNIRMPKFFLTVQ